MSNHETNDLSYLEADISSELPSGPPPPRWERAIARFFVTQWRNPVRCPC